MPNLARVLSAVLLFLTPQASSPAQTQAPGTGVVAGQAIDATTGRPIGGAVVTLAAGGPPAVSATGVVLPPPPQARRGIAVANAEGRFVFRDVPAGSYSLTSTLDGYAPGASGRKRPGGAGRTFTLADGERLIDAAISMWRLGAISGYVRDDRGEPAIGVSVWAYRRVMNAGRLELTFNGGAVEATDERGYYRLSNITPGSYVLGIRTSPHTVAASSAEAYRAAVTSGTLASISQQWMQTGAIQIQGRGLTVGDWVLHFSSGDSQPLPGPQGTVLRHPNVFHANVTAASDATALTIAPGDDRSGIDLTLPLVAGVRISGRLMGPDGPAANHGIRLIPAGGSEPVHEIPAGYATTDTAGRFALLGVTPGSYIVRAYRVQPAGPAMRVAPPAAGAPPISRVEPMVIRPTDGTPPLFAELPVTVGASHVDDLSLTLQPGARITGRVIFDGAMAAPPPDRLQQITLTVRPLTGTLPGSTDARADAEGRFAFNGFPPGRYTLFAATPPGPEWTLASFRIGGVEAAGQAFALGDRDISDAVVTFTDKTIALSGAVHAGDGKTDADSTVVLFPAGTDEWLRTGMSARRVATAATSPAGTYQLRVPLPGEYLVVAVPPEVAPDIDREFIKRFSPAALRVTLLPGDSKTLPLTIARVK